MSINQPHVSPTMAEKTPTRKFMFERSFGEGMAAGGTDGDKPKPVYTAEQMEATRQEAFNSGFSAGQKATQDEQQQTYNVFFAKLEQQLELITTSGTKVWQSQLAHFEQMALTIARKILPEFAATNGLSEIQAIITQVVSDMSREPRLVVRVSEDQFDAVNARIKDITDRQAYAGKVVLLGEASLVAGDCRVEWADGGIERDQQKLWQEIERLMQQAHSLSPSSP